MPVAPRTPGKRTLTEACVKVAVAQGENCTLKEKKSGKVMHQFPNFTEVLLISLLKCMKPLCPPWGPMWHSQPPPIPTSPGGKFFWEFLPHCRLENVLLVVLGVNVLVAPYSTPPPYRCFPHNCHFLDSEGQAYYPRFQPRVLACSGIATSQACGQLATL